MDSELSYIRTWQVKGFIVFCIPHLATAQNCCQLGHHKYILTSQTWRDKIFDYGKIKQVYKYFDLE